MNVAEAARKLFLSPDGLRKRIRKGYIRVEKVPYGRYGSGGKISFRWDISEQEIERILSK